MKKEKITLKQMRADLESLMNNRDENGDTLAQKTADTAISGYDIPKIYPFPVRPVIRNGISVRQIFCTKCGNVFDEWGTQTGRERLCPNCGNQDTYDSNEYVFFTESSESDYQKFVLFTIETDAEFGEKDSVVTKATVRAGGAFASSLGIRFMDRYCPGKLISPGSSDWQRKYNELRSAVCFSPEQTEIRDRIVAQQTEITNRAPEKKAPRPMSKAETLLMSLELTPMDEILGHLSGHAAYIKDMENYDIKGIYVYCDETGESFACDITEDKEPFYAVNAYARQYDKTYTFTCPSCGEVHLRKNDIKQLGAWMSTYERTVVWYDVTEGPDGSHYLVQRAFKIRYPFDNENAKVTRECTEICRKYYGKTKAHIFNYDSKGKCLRPGRTPDIFSVQSALQTVDEITEKIMASDLARSGYAEAMRQNMSGAAPTSIKNNYADAFYRDDRIEKLCKAGFSVMASEMVRGINCLPEEHKNETSLRGILGVKNADYLKLKQLNPSMNGYAEFMIMLGLDPGVTPEEFEEARTLDINLFFRAMEETGVSAKAVLDYLDKCRDFQCIDTGEALSLWKDYVSMATDMNYDLSDKSRLFPSSLKLAHDKATFSYKVVADKMKSENFKKRTRSAKRYEYSNKNDGLMAVVPETAEDVVREGTNLKHCVASYVSSIENGSTNILFIRKIDDPDKSYYTAEVRDDAITQLRGFCNRAAEPCVRRFVNHWAATCHLAIRA